MEVNQYNRKTKQSGVAAGGPHYPQPNKDQVDKSVVNTGMNNTAGRAQEIAYIKAASDQLAKGKK